MSAELFGKEAKNSFRDRAQESLQKYGPGVVCIYMNTQDKEEWERQFGEDLDPGVEGVPLVDNPRHPRNRANVVYQRDFENWRQGKPFEARGDMAKKGSGRRPKPTKR